MVLGYRIQTYDETYDVANCCEDPFKLEDPEFKPSVEEIMDYGW